MSDVRLVKYHILKKGRKWFEGEVPDKGWKAKILINEVSQDWNVGDEKEFPAELDIERSRYGTTVKVYPVSSEKYRDMEKEKLKNRMEEEREKIAEYVNDRGWYPDGIAEKYLNHAKILEQKYGEEGLVEKAKEFVNEQYEIYKHKNAWKKYNKLKSNVLNLTENDKYTYFKELVEKMSAYAEKYEDIKEDYNAFVENEYPEKEIEMRKAEYWRYVKRQMSKLEDAIDNTGVAYSNFDFDKLEDMLSKMEKEGFKEIVDYAHAKMQEIADRQEREWEEFRKQFNPTTWRFFTNELHLSPMQLKNYVEHGKIDPKTEYYRVPEPDWAVTRNILKEYGGASILKTKEGFIIIAPVEKEELIARLKEEITQENMYKLLSTIPLEDEPVSDDEIEDYFPTSWNHYKGEFVGTLTEDLKISYLSERENYTRSGANAELVVDGFPSDVGSFLLIHGGSHKHMELSLYRRDADGWHFLASSEGGGGYYGGSAGSKLWDIFYQVASMKAKQIVEEFESEKEDEMEI